MTRGVGRTATVSSLSYDAAGQIVGVGHRSLGAGDVANYQVTRDSLGNPTRVLSSNAGNLTVDEYTYDAVSRLTSVCRPEWWGQSCSPSSTKTTYTYDKVGNRKKAAVTSIVRGKARTITTTSTYDAADQLLTESTAGAVTASFGYDANGRQTSATTTDGTQTRTYGASGELMSVDLTDGRQVTYTRDASGNETSRSVDGMLDASWSWDLATGLAVRTGQYDAQGELSQTWLPDPTSGTGANLASTTTTTGANWLLTDPFSTVTAAASTGDGSQSGSRVLDPFGMATTGSPASGVLAGETMGFHGQFRDDLTGLDDLRARAYDARLGRFVGPDAVSIPTGATFENAYGYASANPLTGIDATGNFSCSNLQGLCDSPAFLWNEVVGFANAAMGMAMAIAHPMDTYWAMRGACQAGLDQWNPDGGNSLEGWLQCTDNLNPMARIRDSFSTSLDSSCSTAQSGQAFGEGLFGVAATAAPLKGLGSAKVPFADPAVTAATRGGVKAPPRLAPPPELNSVRSAPPSAFTRTEALSGRASSRTVAEITESMRLNGWQGEPIKVVELNGEKIVVDGHHRLAAAKRAGIDVQYEVVDPSTVIGPGKWSSVDEILRDAYSVGPNRIQ
ncbi:RHS repeat-associated core domain-containing protein [Cellulomonas sp.]|uniref:RHS repeat-associated core and ParB-like nuclease domain-containing protein n=1 Tax=Cellulomonas sp. TaxID=40001 RepID=UPI001B215AA7|nr:RHS repeat-associated core domain-containing protein [Cellulomonas sp.]MBO9555128.1 ParB N-terminal domain-containing protein [Cellulomonas sp.]